MNLDHNDEIATIGVELAELQAQQRGLSPGDEDNRLQAKIAALMDRKDRLMKAAIAGH